MVKNNLRKIDIVKILSNKTGYSQSFSKKLVNDFTNSLILNIKRENLHLKNIGKFNKIYKKERIGRNPKTKEPFMIKSRFSISFIPSKRLLNTLNNLK